MEDIDRWEWEGGRTIMPILDLGYIARDITYKPGWEFKVEIQHRRPILIIKAYVQHSETLEWVTFDIKRLIPRSVSDEAQFIDWVEDMVDEAEHHETREFFRYKGTLVDNPHEVS